MMQLAIKLNFKRLFLFGFLSLIPLLLMLILIHEAVGSSLEKTAFSHLKHINESKKTSLSQWFTLLETELNAIAVEIKQHADLDSPELTNEKVKKIINQHKDLISFYISIKDFKTLWFIDLDGNFLYKQGTSVYMKPDKAFVEHSLSLGEVYIHDHEDEQDTPHITRVIYDSYQEPIMILVGFFDTDKINDIMQINNEHWITNETYLVDDKMRIRSKLRLDPSITKIDTEAAQKALEGMNGEDILRDYRGELVYTVFSPFIYDNIQWAIISDVDLREVSAPLRALERYIVIIFIGLAIFSFLIILFILFYQRRYEEKLEYQANYDALTHLPNRMMLNNHLSYLVEHYQHGANKKLAIMFLDVDHFKEINDSYGHRCGDLLLIEITKRVQASLRSIDFVARMSGDEFIIIVERYEEINDLYLIADKIIDSMAAPFKDATGEKQFSISVSIGIAVFKKGETKEQLLRNADVAMYEAKKQGRNRFVLYEEHMTEDLKHYLEIKGYIIEALENEYFYMLFQPKYDTESSKINGFEILLRMKNREGETILPNEFISAAEKSGHIIEIDKWMITHAIEKISQLQAATTLKFSVNISTQSIYNDAFIETLFNALEKYNVKGSSLAVELTESIMLKYDQHLKEILEKLHRNEIHVSIDNFGSGYSSLHHLQSLPIHALKIDTTFIHNMAHSKSAKEIVQAIIQIGHTYNYQVIAEGVETEEELQILKELQCDSIQGYLYSKPVLFEELEKLL